MAQGTFTVTSISDSGIAPTLSTPSASGDLFANAGNEFVYISNLSGVSDRTITIAATHACTFGTMHNISVVVSAGTSKLLGPFATRWYSDASDKICMTYDAITSLSVAVFRLIPA